MIRELYPYYDRELSFMRDMAGEFARNYPHAAARLDLERHRCDDPHVERLIEAFSLIAARIHHRLDADAPEISQALLNLIYPHYLRPIPSMSIMQFRLETSEWKRHDPVQVAQGTEIEIGEDLCKFRTCHAAELWPIKVSSGSVLDATDLPSWSRAANTVAGVLVEVRADQPIAKLQDLQSLRFYLAGAGNLPFTLYELILKNCHSVLLHDPESRKPPIVLSADRLRGVGFSTNEPVLPYDGRSFLGFRLLHEYFAFPNRFLFFDLSGLECLQPSGTGGRLEILFALDSTLRRSDEFATARLSTSAENFLLGCAPVVNLFGHVAEQISLDQTRAEYQIIPDNDRTKTLEVYSIDGVVSRQGGTWTTRTYRPFFSFRHGEADEETKGFWHSVRRPSRRGTGTEVFLSIVDPEFRPAEPADEVFDIRLTCTNRDLPGELALMLTFGEVKLSDSRVVSRFVHHPTRTQSPPVERGLDWRVISMLGLNYLSLGNNDDLDGDEGVHALRELLALYDFSDDPAILRRISALKALTSHPSRARMMFPRGTSRVPVFCHGLTIDLDLDAEAFGGSGVFLFVSILERFFALYSSISSFSQLNATLSAVEPRRRAVWRYEPRSGEQVLL